MKYKYSYGFSIYTLLLFLLMSLGCKKFVQISAPDTKLVTSSVFSNSTSATSAVLAIYISMFNNADSYNISEDQGLMSDELTNYSTNISQIQYYTNALLPVNNPGDWVNGYNYIYQANALISGLQNNEQIPAAIAQQLTGEAKFVRAFWNFYLTNMYGNIPLVTTTDYTINESLPRSSQALVYAQITQDLQDAVALLNGNYVDATDTAVTTQRVRPTKAAAEALLASVYLYWGKYDSAKTEANNVINNGLYSLCTNLNVAGRVGRDSVFLMNSTETIWQISTPLPNNDNTSEAQGFILFGAPGGTSNNSTTISPQLLAAFEPGDLRRLNWVDSIVESGITYYFPYKYQAVNTTQLTEFTMVLRLAEQYLIRAEAEANLGDMTAASADVNVIRARAGLGASPTLTASSTLQQADSAILHERQVELFTEWGHRWFDLIRMDSVNSVLGSPGNVCRSKGGVWNPDWALYPVPQSEIANDVHLNQNSGY
jgi:starch-binding outer membrane protein, SusD/RagB family